MGRRPRGGEEINGLLLLNKPPNCSSNDILQKVKRLFNAKRVGHTGALDPLATGLLPLCFGEATKFSQFLLNSDKSYRCWLRLGMTTDTGDADGQPLSTADTTHISMDMLTQAMKRFLGASMQLPPMYSAVKMGGKKLYQYAREGLTIERQQRPIKISQIQLHQFVAGEQASAEIEVHCSKGTYIRTLVEDIGVVLGCGAHVTGLHRIRAGTFNEQEMVSIEALRQTIDAQKLSGQQLETLLLPVQWVVRELPVCQLSALQRMHLYQGKQVVLESLLTVGQVYQLHVGQSYIDESDGATGSSVTQDQQQGNEQNSSFFGVGEAVSIKMLRAKRLMVF